MTSLEPTSVKQAQGISGRVVRETEHDFEAAVAVSIETARTGEFLTEPESEELSKVLGQQSDLLARVSLDSKDLPEFLTTEEIGPAIENIAASIAGALRFDTASQAILDDVKRHASTKLKHDQMPPIVQRLHNQQLSAFECMTRWNFVSRTILRYAGVLLNYTGLSMKQLLPEVQPKIHIDNSQAGFNMESLNPAAHSKDKNMAGRPHLKTATTMSYILRNVDFDLGDKLPIFIRPFIEAYRSWQEATMAVPVALPTFREPSSNPQEQVATPPPAELMQGLQNELQALVAAHSEQTESFRPAWAQMQRLGLRPFSTALRQLGRGGEKRTPATATEVTPDSAKRLTGLLHVAETLGTEPEQELRERFLTLVRDEYITKINIDRILASLREADAPQGEPDWLPVTRDFDFLRAHWGELEPQLLSSWVPTRGTKVEALKAIKASMQAFRKASFELQHPELRLERMAKSLGAVALPPEARPEQPVPYRGERRNQAVSDTLRSMAASEEVSENKRQRALVLAHFIDLAESQRQPDDGENFGELFHSEPIKSGKTRYYIVMFRSTYDNSKWNLLESFDPDTASYVIPQRLADEYGSLKEVVSDFGKKEQQALGGLQVIHVENWNPERHIERIMQKIKPENSVNNEKLEA